MTSKWLNALNPGWWDLNTHPRVLRMCRRADPRWIKRRRETGHEAWSHAEAAIENGALHKPYELAALFSIVIALRPRNVLEIGLSVGGTFDMWHTMAADDAVIVGLDLKLPDTGAPKSNGRQRIELVAGDSHLPATLERVNALLPDGLDFLFIDGDHSYAGVKQDYAMYGPLVRKGGVIAFHDIHADYRSRYGRDCLEDSGQVHHFWAELKAQSGAREIIQDARQSGYGIGVVRV